MGYLPGIARALRNPRLLDTFDVMRRKTAISTATGRPVDTTTVFADQTGVVCSASANDLERLPEGDRMGRNLSVVTNFKLIGPARDAAGSTYKPDIVVWRGDDYVVKSLDPYPQFGEGFVQAIVGSVDLLDRPS